VACLRDGRLVAALESEKITRHKHEVSVFPETAMRFILKTGGVTMDDIDAIALNYDARPLANKFYLPQLWRMLRAGSFDLGVVLNNVQLAGSHHHRVFRQLREHRLPKLVHVRHHLAHVASAFPYSPFEEAAVAVIDASGECECTSVYHCAGRKIRRIQSMDLPADSLGYVYMMATRHLGYAMLGDEYKVMGLAAFGQPHQGFRKFFTDLVTLLPQGRYRVDPSLAGRIFDNGWKFAPRVERMLGGRREPGDELTQEHKDFAFELQRRLEEALIHVVRHLHQVTRARFLCMAGGVALNSVANGKLLQESGFEEIFIPPAPHDAGTAVGAATYHHYYELRGQRPEPWRHAYLGAAYDDAFIEHELQRCKQSYERLENPARAAAAMLVSGQVIGWFQGATEFGPRALGNRSILADPRHVDSKERVNQFVKEREGYRPFAPAILAEEASAYFEHLVHSPFMLFVDTVRAERRAQMAAVLNVDCSARPQTVERDVNPLFHELIAQFRELTGVPAVLNTSFNVAGEPIVNTPADAVRCFHGSGLDALVVGPFVVRKHQSMTSPGS
jgi:carbamoyltransferase